MKITEILRDWLAPVTDDAVNRELDTANIRTCRRLGLVFAVAQTAALIVYLLCHLGALGEHSVSMTVLRVFLSSVFCLAAFPAAGGMLRRDGTLRFGHRLTNLILTAFFVLMVLWGMAASVGHYKSGQQMMAYYTVLIVIALFFRIRPIISITVIGVASFAYYFYLEYAVCHGMIHPYNFAVFVLVVLCGSVANYRTAVRGILQTRRVEVLNDTLEEIANHDSLTHLQNRHALNRRLPEYLGKDICLALLDVDKFKTANDTYGHKKGDELLRCVADAMTALFSAENVYRYGGDEFLIVCEQTDEAAFEERLNDLNERLARSSRVPIACSYGFVRVTADTAGDFFEAIVRADSRLYAQKREKSAVNIPPQSTPGEP